MQMVSVRCVQWELMALLSIYTTDRARSRHLRQWLAAVSKSEEGLRCGALCRQQHRAQFPLSPLLRCAEYPTAALLQPAVHEAARLCSRHLSCGRLRLRVSSFLPLMGMLAPVALIQHPQLLLRCSPLRLLVYTRSRMAKNCAAQAGWRMAITSAYLLFSMMRQALRLLR